ncbi:MAG: PhoH family protein [Geminicoccaceae bacterium]
MGETSLKPVPASLDVDSSTLTFEDNGRCALLFGRHHEHLAQIEQHIPATLVARGNEVTISGASDQIAAAKAVLSDLDHRLQQGIDLSKSEVDAAIRMVVGGEQEAKSKKKGFRGQDELIETERKRISPRSPNQSRYVQLMHKHDLVFGLGPAGTGKTYLAVAMGASLLRRRMVDRLILSRPAVEAGERLGFLPGDMKDKVDPYLRPLYDALQDMLPEGKFATRLESGHIEVAPLAFMRGRTLSNAFVILDEAQNTTPAQMMMFLTRLGENSRMVVTGDPAQHDLPPGTLSGLDDAVAKLDGLSDVGMVQFTQKDVVRHPLVSKIIDAYRHPADDDGDRVGGSARREGGDG